jgi:hypothetical protein
VPDHSLPAGSCRHEKPDLPILGFPGGLYLKSDAYFPGFTATFIYRNHKVVIMPRAGEGRSIRIDPDVYEALLTLKRGNMTFSSVIANLLHHSYGWSDDLPTGQKELADFTGHNER